MADPTGPAADPIGPAPADPTGLAPADEAASGAAAVAARRAPLVLYDDDIRAGLDAPGAIDAMRRALIAAEHGELLAPPRLTAEIGDGRMVFTVGASTGRWFGYRSYDTLDTPAGEQVVVAHDWRTGLVDAIALGTELGARRTGALGGVAVDVLARPDATRVGIIGTGTQAWTQLWAAAAVRPLGEVAVCSRDPSRRNAFVRRARAELDVDAHVASSARDAVTERDIVVLATSSPTPVVEPEWISAGCHVTALGPKQTDRAEMGVELADRSGVIATDSPAQIRSYQPPFVLDGTADMDRIVSLGAILEGSADGRSTARQITLYCSTGLAGTEIHLLVDLARAHRSGRGGRPPEG